MNNFFLLISPNQIIVFLCSMIFIAMFSFVLMSKNEKKLNFLIWTLLILFLPFIGGLSYLIKHYTSRNSIVE
jgi:drug/metabolite transporter (DMT)-like permease